MIKSTGFTPVLDVLVKETGSLYAAYIYGFMYLNRSAENVFDRSLNEIVRLTQMSRTTVFKWVKFLCDNEYITDMTPDENRKPHTYKITGKANISVEIVFHRGARFREGGSQQMARGVASKWLHGYARNGYHEHDMMHVTWSKILTTWQHLGLGEWGLYSLIETHWSKTSPDDVLQFLEQWHEADEQGRIPDDWGAGLLYIKIRDGELPPEKEVTFGDEVRELMEQMDYDDQPGD